MIEPVPGLLLSLREENGPLVVDGGAQYADTAVLSGPLPGGAGWDCGGAVLGLLRRNAPLTRAPRFLPDDAVFRLSERLSGNLSPAPRRQPGA